jgi:molybdate transport repressor ModE-like protein
MYKVSIKPQWAINDAKGEVLSQRLLELLLNVQEYGSLSGACKASGGSYRHAWNLVREGEEQLGMALLNKEKGKGSTLTPLGEKLVWAERRIVARLTPTLESLSSELEVELSTIMSPPNDVLKVHASHGFAIEKLIETLVKSGKNVERKYVGSQESAASLFEGNCDIAGFHIPQGEFEDQVFEKYAKWVNLKESRIIHIATRRQGLMVAQGNPLDISGIKDLIRPGIRFINRQPSSGTHLLLECFLKKEIIDPKKIIGFNQSEFTHAAIAAYVASGMADVGLGVETPSHRFKLDFIPLATERYFLMCHQELLQTPNMLSVLQILNSDEFKTAINGLPGYTADQCGVVETVAQAFPNWGK